MFAERNIFTRLIVRMDQWLGYGRQDKQPRFEQDPSVIKVGF